MPRISHFHGIAIYMYYRDHAPPHFHAIYGEFEATVEIATATPLDGQIPQKAWSQVREWTRRRRVELDENWGLARTGQPLHWIPPL
jgi:hypothetical protein